METFCLSAIMISPVFLNHFPFDILGVGWKQKMREGGSSKIKYGNRGPEEKKYGGSGAGQKILCTVFTKNNMHERKGYIGNFVGTLLSSLPLSSFLLLLVAP